MVGTKLHFAHTLLDTQLKLYTVLYFTLLTRKMQAKPCIVMGRLADHREGREDKLR